MMIRDLIDELIQIETETSPEEDVLIDVKGVPGIDEVFGCLIEGMARDADGSWAIQAVAP
jgi:hypothetical protein